MAMGQEIRDFVAAFQAGYKMVQDADYDRERMRISNIELKHRERALDIQEQGLYGDKVYRDLQIEGQRLDNEGQRLDNADPTRRRAEPRGTEYDNTRERIEGYENATGASASAEGLPSLVRAVASRAQERGYDPIDVLTLISYETGGSMSPTQRGPTTHLGQHEGLIQYGPEERRTYDVRPDLTMEEQADRVFAYLDDRGYKGTGFLDMYSTVNAGRPGRYNASDGYGTVQDKVNSRRMQEHRAKATDYYKRYANVEMGIPDDGGDYV